MTSAAVQYLESAIECHKRGEFAAAERHYRQALAIEPRNVYAVHFAGMLALQSNNFPLASERLKQAVELGIGLPDTHFMLGRALKAQGDFQGAIYSYRRAIESDPGMCAAHISLGLALKELGRLAEAVEAYRNALRLNSDSFEARINLGNALQLQGQYDGALSEYEKARELQPESPQIHYNIGKVLRAQQRDVEAVERFQKAVLLDPDFLEAYHNLANTLTTIGQYTAAIDCFRHLQSLLKAGAGRVDKPETRERLKRDALTGIAAPLAWTARYDEALPIILEALQDDPDSVVLSEFHLLALPYRCESREELLDAYSRYQRITPYRDAEPLSRASQTKLGDTLKIGYVSGDLRDHSVAFFIEPLLANHDKQTIETVCYSTNRADDEVTERLKSHAGLWVNAGELDGTAFAQRVADDGVDILVDLSGRTVENRLGLFARQPAPLQVGYLGYPTYTGVPQIAYRITDAVIDPEGEEGLASERPLRLPHTMFCYRPPADVPVLERSGIKDRGFVCFGSFNQVQKLSPTILAAWATLLHAVPDSRLLLKANGFNDSEARQRIIDILARRGISPERVLIREGIAQRDDHLAMYGEMDIALDTFPYNGATTSCEAMWMGTPVVTLRGETHPSRMGASILTAMGLPELIADSIEQYIDIAVSLAADGDILNDLHATLRQRMANSPLCDEQGFTRGFEHALREAWQQQISR